MDTSSLKTQFLTELNSLNSTVHACFTSSATLPESISPTEATFALAEALTNTQEAYNAAATAPPYINVVTKAFNGNPTIFEGNLIRSRERTINFWEALGPISTDAPTTGTRPVIL